jgi:type I site-specific restriction endonuclease
VLTPLNLRLTDFQPNIRIKKTDNKTYIWDFIRKKWLVLQPEEHVRQLLIQYLIQEKQASLNRMAIEKAVQVNTMSQRYDLVVFNRNHQAFMLVECKAPSVSINADAFMQISRYNRVLKTPFLLVTNGLDTYCCQVNYALETIEFLNEIPVC